VFDCLFASDAISCVWSEAATKDANTDDSRMTDQCWVLENGKDGWMNTPGNVLCRLLEFVGWFVVCVTFFFGRWIGGFDGIWEHRCLFGNNNPVRISYRPEFLEVSADACLLANRHRAS